MLSEMEPYEVEEWRAFFRLRKQKQAEGEKQDEAESRAKGGG